MELVILIGLQGSGKSSFCHSEFGDTHLRVSLDMVRTRRREEAILKAALAVGQRVVVDNTNPTVEDRSKYIQWAKEHHFRTLGYYLSSKLEPCLERNRQRSGRKRVPDKGVLATYSKLVLPTVAEGFDQLYYVQLGENGFEVEPWSDEI